MNKSEALELFRNLEKYPSTTKFDPQVTKEIVKARQWFLKYYQDPQKIAEFLEDLIWIKDGSTNESIPFKLNRAQTRVLAAYQKKRRVAIIKARQQGITTLTNGIYLWRGIFGNQPTIRIMGKDADGGEKNLKRIKDMFLSMPKFVQGFLIEQDEKKGHRSSLSYWSFLSKASKTEVVYQTATASSEDAARGDQPTDLHWTETAFSPVANEIFAAIYPGIRRRKNSGAILESTGNGASGLFYEICSGQRDGFEVVFLPWFEEPGYSEAGVQLTETERLDILEMIEVDVPELSDEQLAWYRETFKTLGKQKCHQEYPSTLEQSFQSTSSSFFTKAAIDSRGNLPVLRYIELSSQLLSFVDRGPCALYAMPDDTMEYLLSADTSRGKNDLTSINVIDPDGKEVAHWHELMDPDKTVDVINELGKFFNNATVAVENNDTGAYVLMRLKSSKFYPNIFSDKGDLGIRTTAGNKAILVSNLQNLMVEGKLSFNNQVMPFEMQTFDSVKLSATDKHTQFDDTVMSAAIGAWVFYRNPPLRRVHTDYFREYNDSHDSNYRSKFIRRR